MNRKKPTNKELIAKVEILTRVNNTLCETMNMFGDVFKNYIEFKGDIEDFKKFTEDKRKFKEKIMNGGSDE